MSYNLNLCSCFVFKSHFWLLDVLSNVSWNKQKHCRSEKRPEACPPCTNTPTCCHDACGGDRQHRDVLGAVRRVEVCRIPSLGSSICLGPRSGDGEKSCLVMGCRGRREGGILLLLLFHLVQEHGILNLSGEWRVHHLWIWHWFNPLIWFWGNKKTWSQKYKLSIWSKEKRKYILSMCCPVLPVLAQWGRETRNMMN